MKLGIFAKTFPRPTLEQTLDAIVAHGLTQVQFNMVCANLPTLPDRIDDALITQIHSAFAERGLEMAALSGTFNLIHPNLHERKLGLERLRILAEAAPSLGANLITLCTGTRDPIDMWAAHPDNNSPAAWDDLLRSLDTLLNTTSIAFGIEPEITNVISSAAKARQLLDHFKTARLKIVIDPANLFGQGELPRMREKITEAFDLLGPDIALAHLKDINFDPGGIAEGSRCASESSSAATGNLHFPSPRPEGSPELPRLLDYDCYLENFRRIKYAGALILHGLAESQVEDSLRFIRQKISLAP
jgi:sugar phosphate isomerase/epimerase